MSEYSAPLGAPIWFDLMSSDPAKAADFYHELFGWDVDAPPNPEMGGYQNFTTHGRYVAGLSPYTQEAGGPPNVWSVYLHSEDLDATAKNTEAAGGTVVVPPMEVGPAGTMMVTLDAAGAAISYWKPNEHRGFTEWGVHGSPYWFECHSKDYDKTLAYYAEVVGARTDEVIAKSDPDQPGPDRYSQLFFGDTAYAGVMDAAGMYPPEVPSFWQVYICVDDVRATVAAAEKLGAEILMAGEDTPYGTLAALKDPMGAIFCLGHPPAGM
ncbi:VOC family protein [Gordonia desulfuricans]|uniref:VOC family protein n=1 Tax=Gordonia desulfuricans TaxID=89051 RepID=A0A7K3LKU8_9ACTN|nr:VOC family protein [Gordonia desulfuricans]NDK88783.1 VOC family protein [Gordonia desulfuricans]